MGFDAVVAEAVGLAAGVYLLIWLLLKAAFRKLSDPPRISLHLFGLSLGLWLSATLFYPANEWAGHFGAVLIFCGTLFGWVLIDHLVSVEWLEKRRHVALPIILRQLGGVLVQVIALAAILKWGYQLELTGLVATSGVAAVILGFAMQDLLANVIAGFSIHMTNAYKVGDWLLIGSTGQRAEVKEINWRSTRLVDNDQISLELPNSEVVKNRIVNLNHPRAEHGVRLKFGLDYDTPPALAKEVLLKVAKRSTGRFGIASTGRLHL